MILDYWKVTVSLVHSFSNFLLNGYHVPGFFLGVEDTVVNKIYKKPTIYI